MRACSSWPNCKPDGPLFSAEFVCESVCLPVSVRHLYPSSLTDFDETWSQGPYCDLVWPRPWSRSAAEGPHNAFLKISQNSQKSEIEFQNSGPLFFVSVPPVYCKKIGLDWNKTDGGDRF